MAQYRRAAMEVKDFVITPEIEKRLKGFVGFDVKATFKYTPKIFRDKNDAGEYLIPKPLWPVFELKSKNGMEIAEVKDKTGYFEYDRAAGESNKAKLHLQSGSMRVETLKKGIISIRKYLMEDGRFIEWNCKTLDLAFKNADGIIVERKGSIPIEKVIEYIPAPMQTELQNAINERSTLSEEELQGLE
jgi:hypothetical protein